MSEIVTSEQEKEDWTTKKWRPMMGWMYMLVCTMDFILFPILWSLLQAMDKGSVTLQWQPITLQGAGLFHMAMGAVLGVAAFGRTQEKIAGANNVGNNISSSGIATPSTPATGSFGNGPSGFYPSTTSNGISGSSAGSSLSSSPTRGSDSNTGFGTAAAGPIAITANGRKIVPPNNDPVI
jgi:hypothetical protein